MNCGKIEFRLLRWQELLKSQTAEIAKFAQTSGTDFLGAVERELDEFGLGSKLNLDVVDGCQVLDTICCSFLPAKGALKKPDVVCFYNRF